MRGPEEIPRGCEGPLTNRTADNGQLRGTFPERKLFQSSALVSLHRPQTPAGAPLKSHRSCDCARRRRPRASGRDGSQSARPLAWAPLPPGPSPRPGVRGDVARERHDVLKEAEILHKARFSYILPILGICNEPEFLGMVTEYMSNGSLNELLHRKTEYPNVAWPLRFRILYEIALGVNYLHNMNPPLLHHDLKTQNILLDDEFHVKIADFGLSKWRLMSISQSRSSRSSPEGGTIIYMPPENYEPGQKSRASIKHDIYSYAVITWEVLSRKQPFEEVTNPLQIMYSVSQGHRPDTSEESLPWDIPNRALMISLIESGWAQNPDERPSFLKCLIELEPVLRTFEEITFLEAVIQLKKTKLQSASSTIHLCDKKNMELSLNIPVNHGPQEESCGSSQLPKSSSSPGTSTSLSASPDNFLSNF